MKPLLILTVAGVFFFSACTDSNQTDEKTDPATPAIQNVNGNMPDTSNSITLDQTPPADTSGVKDTSRR